MAISRYGGMIILLLQGLVIYIIYHITTFPSVPGGDSGELLAESCSFGTSHPPGYPTYTMMSKLVSMIPSYRFYINNSNSNKITSDKIVFNNLYVDKKPLIAWKVNHLCCILGMLSSVLLSATVMDIYQIINNRKSKNSHNVIISSSIASFLYSFSPLIWEYSITAEVFALNNFCCSILLFLTVRIFREIRYCETLTNANDVDKAKVYIVYLMFCGAFFSGISLSNQHASLLHIVVLIPFILLITASNHILTIKNFFLSGLSFIAGLAPYTYLYVASLHPTKGSWGDLSTPYGLIKHIIREEYGTFQLGIKQGDEDWKERIFLYIEHASQEFSLNSGISLLPLAIVGVITLSISDMITMKSKPKLITGQNRNKNKSYIKNNDKNDSNVSINSPMMPIVLCILVLWLFYVLVWHCVLSNLPLNSPMPFAVHSRFWMQPNLVICLMIGIGAGTSLEVLFYLISLGKKLNIPTLVHVSIEVALSILTLILILRYRYDYLNKSSNGWIMHKYGAIKLDSLPPHSLLLSHTDLDWNTVRYLSHCERHRPDVTHLNFQLMPYPWFKRQEPLYPHINFPDTNFKGVSTDRTTQGNTLLVRRFLQANNADSISPQKVAKNLLLSGGIYLDMQSVNEPDIGDCGLWHGLTLLPYGTLYKVYGHLQNNETVSLHKLSYKQLVKLQKDFPIINDDLVSKYPKGSWERAAMNVYYDAHYQLGLFLLTYSIDAMKTADEKNIPIILDRLRLASLILMDTVMAIEKYDTISSSIHDVYKNSALAWMRLQALVLASVKFKDSILNEGNKMKKALIKWDKAKAMLTNEGVIKTLQSADKCISIFVNTYPKDKDVQVFKTVIQQIRTIVDKGTIENE